MPLRIDLQMRKRTGGQAECTSLLHMISVHVYWPWLFVVRAYLIRMMEKRKEERTPYCAISSKHIYMNIRPPVTSRSFVFTLLPLHPGTPGIPRGPTAPGCPGKPF